MTEARTGGGKVIRRGPYPELTWTAILVGYGLGFLITISMGYACLILGFSHEGSELAAILGFGVLRGILRRNSIIENNISQTVASSVNGASAGIMFSVPALFILGQTDFNPCLMVFGAIAGGVLGIAFIIPLRKQMIDFERLTYPGGVAVATVLKSPGAGVHKAILLVIGAALSATVAIVSHATGFENWALGAYIGMPDYMNGVWFVSLLTIGIGFIAGKGGLCFVIGGYACYWVLAPILARMGLLPTPEQLQSLDMAMPDYLRVSLFRPVGIGMLVGGALAGIALALPLIVSAVRSMQSAARTGAALSKDEMPIKLLYIGVVGAVIVLGIVAVLSVEQMGLARGILMAVLGTIWIWMAGVILSECIGRTNWSPMSGMTLIGVTILIVITRGLGDKAAMISSVMVGAATCMAMSQATDLMLDLKTGYLVGAIPRRQQIGQFLASWIGPILMVGLLFVLHKAYGLGSEKLPAPQGTVLASMIRGILEGDVPVYKYLAGAGLGALLSTTGIGGLGIQVGLGFYLPFGIVLTYTIGTVLRVVSDRMKGRHFSEQAGIPIAAGLIIGEGLVGVGFAVYSVIVGMKGG
ncbi:MAG TPA: OPT/YSL family transporter [Sedimentisphaerales bacterium]|nr:OPT/YSL family transporter [Sedimentisphaerales bacterium]HRS10597.1 OPT/YSL family transporter [Sedimentisphaerales bacterium]HRV47179.1 OPT/YSL family transporter [Sedimentisphaerales bacterium]